MPILRLIDKEAKEVYTETFPPTGKPLPRMIERNGNKYQFEIKTGDTYIYKQF